MHSWKKDTKSSSTRVKWGRVIAMATIAGAACSFAQAAEPKRQFDLNCNGTTREEKSNLLIASKSKPIITTYSTVIMVDLDLGVFCQDDCKAPEKIVLVDPEFIRFRDQQIPTRDLLVARRAEASFMHVREPLEKDAQGDYVTRTAQGTCVVAPYTGMPQRLF